MKQFIIPETVRATLHALLINHKNLGFSFAQTQALVIELERAPEYTCDCDKTAPVIVAASSDSETSE